MQFQKPLVDSGLRSVTSSSSAENLTIRAHDDVVCADATSGNITLTLEAASRSIQRTYTILKTDSSANTVTIDPNGAETINGAATLVIDAQYAWATIYTDGTEWFAEDSGSVPVSSGVGSVTASDTSLTISPTTGSVLAALNVGNANTWTALQTFSHANGISTDNVIEENAAAGVTIDGVLLKDSGATFGANVVMGDFSITGIDTLTFTDTAGTIAGIENQNLLDKTATETVSGAYTFSHASGISTDDIIERVAAAGVTVDGVLLKDSGITVAADIVMGDNSVTGIDTLTFTDTAGTIAGIQNQNLLDKGATETVSGAYTFSHANGIATDDIIERTGAAGVTIDGVIVKDSGLTVAANIVMGDNSVTGIDTLTFTDVNGTIAGIENQNLLDKTAPESISGAYTFTSGTALFNSDVKLDFGTTNQWEIEFDTSSTPPKLLFEGSSTAAGEPLRITATKTAQSTAASEHDEAMVQIVADWATTIGVPGKTDCPMVFIYNTDTDSNGVGGAGCNALYVKADGNGALNGTAVLQVEGPNLVGGDLFACYAPEVIGTGGTPTFTGAFLKFATKTVGEDMFGFYADRVHFGNVLQNFEGKNTFFGGGLYDGTTTVKTGTFVNQGTTSTPTGTMTDFQNEFVAGDLLVAVNQSDSSEIWARIQSIGSPTAITFTTAQVFGASATWDIYKADEGSYYPGTIVLEDYLGGHLSDYTGSGQVGRSGNLHALWMTEGGRFCHEMTATSVQGESESVGPTSSTGYDGQFLSRVGQDHSITAHASSDTEVTWYTHTLSINNPGYGYGFPYVKSILEDRGTMHFKSYGQILQNATGTFDISVDVGSATGIAPATGITVADDSNRYTYIMDVWVTADESTSAQKVCWEMVIYDSNGAYETSAGGYGTAAEDMADTATIVDIDLRFKWSANSASLSFEPKATWEVVN